MYLGTIPKWAWLLFAIVAFDDALGWLRSPYLMIPLVIVILIVIVIFLVGGKDMAVGLLNTAKTQGTGMLTNLTTQAAKKMMKNE